MRIKAALIASIVTLPLALPGSALANGAALTLAAPEEEELVIDEEPPADGDSEEAKLERAKALYAEGAAAAEKGDWKEAETKYEQAYHLVPSKHGFAHKVGIAAYKADDCDKAVEYLVHFIHYTDHEKHGDKVEESRGVLAELLKSGCTTEEAIFYYHLSNEERSEMARGLYIEGETFAKEGNWRDAEERYEAAYNLVPHKIGFSHKVGIAAYNAWTKGNEEGNPRQEDCDKSHEYLVHFVDSADPEKYADKITESSEIITELTDTCVSKESLEEHQVTEPGEVSDDDNPFAEGGSKTPGKKPNKNKNKGKKGLLIAGAALTVVGAAGLGVGAAGLVLASGTASELTDLASVETPTGYPVGSYEDAQPIEQRLGTQKLMGYLGLGIGGAVFVTGIALIAVHASKNKNKASSSARLESIAPSFTRDSVGASALVRF